MTFIQVTKARNPTTAVSSRTVKVGCSEMLTIRSIVSGGEPLTTMRPCIQSDIRQSESETSVIYQLLSNSQDPDVINIPLEDK